jgi:hypothetical protein
MAKLTKKKSRNNYEMGAGNGAGFLTHNKRPHFQPFSQAAG